MSALPISVIPHVTVDSWTRKVVRDAQEAVCSDPEYFAVMIDALEQHKRKQEMKKATRIVAR